ncbi:MULTISPECIES: PIN domain-containing protein [Roseobacteraceae]|uniref:tRNA(fMet)-specific endonuclease VapC n=1 Tax=Pseudosulfitobacter pseudonitzschiae TaxID=1402135 RepID=A0A221K720_9RHOB|nr:MULTISPECIES: type II toxin-antitoxin system VapC family toxin [Roseobacteraceae]ASM74804.1 tRNA(fMet)-specific endonuclease VapC [Pseudosulfitobacter pseudonitzschiae]
MIGIDSNVLVRFLTQDDPAQSAAATRLLGQLTMDSPAFVAREVMIKTVWVLERAYRFDRARIAQALEGLLEAEELQIEAADAVGLALHRYGAGGPSFADHMIQVAAQATGCTTTYTFDCKAAATDAATLLV